MDAKSIWHLRILLASLRFEQAAVVPEEVLQALLLIPLPQKVIGKIHSVSPRTESIYAQQSEALRDNNAETVAGATKKRTSGLVAACGLEPQTYGS